jgi:hypothetical protein
VHGLLHRVELLALVALGILARIPEAQPEDAIRLVSQLESKVLALRIAQLPAQLRLVSIFKVLHVKRDGSRQVLHIVSVTLDVAFQLRQSEVVWIKGEEAQMLKGSRQYPFEPIFVAFRYMSYADVVQIDLVLLMKQTASHAKL